MNTLMVRSKVKTTHVTEVETGIINVLAEHTCFTIHEKEKEQCQQYWSREQQDI